MDRSSLRAPNVSNFDGEIFNTDINLLVEIPVPPHRGSQEAGGRGDVVFSRSGSPRNIC